MTYPLNYMLHIQEDIKKTAEKAEVPLLHAVEMHLYMLAMDTLKRSQPLQRAMLKRTITGDKGKGPGHTSIHVPLELIAIVGLMIESGAISEERAKANILKLHRKENPGCTDDHEDMLGTKFVEELPKYGIDDEVRVFTGTLGEVIAQMIKDPRVMEQLKTLRSLKDKDED